MRNASFLVEIAGNYSCGEVHIFHRLSVLFGVYHARIQTNQLRSHNQEAFNLTSNDLEAVAAQVQKYFTLEPFLAS